MTSHLSCCCAAPFVNHSCVNLNHRSLTIHPTPNSLNAQQQTYPREACCCRLTPLRHRAPQHIPPGLDVRQTLSVNKSTQILDSSSSSSSSTMHDCDTRNGSVMLQRVESRCKQSQQGRAGIHAALEEAWLYSSHKCRQMTVQGCCKLAIRQHTPNEHELLSCCCTGAGRDHLQVLPATSRARCHTLWNH
jgi:hypothetical protein